MAKPAELEKLTGLASRFGAFVAERHPFALADSLEVFETVTANRLKAFFLGGEVRFGGTALQGKGFRSLGQEAIYGAAMRLRRGPKYRGDGSVKTSAERWDRSAKASAERWDGSAKASAERS